MIKLTFGHFFIRHPFLLDEEVRDSKPSFRSSKLILTEHRKRYDRKLPGNGLLTLIIERE